MDKIIGYNHTFSNTNIKPAFVDIEIIGSVIYHAYYFILYPTGLAIVLAVPNELASISYNPTTNYFTTADSLSSGMVKLASITPKIYQFVGASQILVSAGAGSNTRSNTSDNAHYKGYYTTPNPISLNTSTKRIVGQGTEYGTLPEILFIDPALGVGQSLPTNDVDTVRYPLYKKDNRYYKSTSVRQSNAQYLSAAGDAFSHSQEYIDLNQDGTRGYASKNKLGILLNSEVRNPVVPSNNNNFTEVTDNNNTKDNYQGDNQRYMTEKYGIKEDGVNSYQLSFAPVSSITGAEGFQINHYISPSTSCSKNNPWILFRNDQGVYNRTDLDLNKDILGIDQFIVQIKGNHFRIPLGWTVRVYRRQGNYLRSFNYGDSAYGSISTKTTGVPGRDGDPTQYSEPGFSYTVGGSTDEIGGLLHLILYSINDGDEKPYFGKYKLPITNCHEYKGNNTNQLVDITTQDNIEHTGTKINVRMLYKLSLNLNDTNSSFYTRTMTANYLERSGSGGEFFTLGNEKRSPITYTIAYDITDVYYPAGFVPRTQPIYEGFDAYVNTVESSYSNSETNNIVSGPRKERKDENGGKIELYRDRRKQTTGYTQKVYLRLSQNVAKATALGLIATDPNNIHQSSLIHSSTSPQPTFNFDYYKDSEHDDYTVETIPVHYRVYNNGNVIGFDFDFYCEGENPDLFYIVAYPEEEE